jgi:pimeloyl-ACP methyl ester carboxylesterase
VSWSRIGNSIGGGTAIRHAATHPEQVRGLILANCSGLDAFDLVTRVACGVMARFFGAGVRGARWFPAVFAAYYRSVLPTAAAAAQRRRIVAAADEIAGACRGVGEICVAERGSPEPRADDRLSRAFYLGGPRSLHSAVASGCTRGNGR